MVNPPVTFYCIGIHVSTATSKESHYSSHLSDPPAMMVSMKVLRQQIDWRSRMIRATFHGQDPGDRISLVHLEILVRI
jgi:hypothetical protein